MSIVLKPKQLIISCPELLTQPDDQHTYIHCAYFSPSLSVNNGWFNIEPTPNLVNVKNTDQRISLIHAINAPIAPEKYYFKKRRDWIYFTLIFNKLPEHWRLFTIAFNNAPRNLKVFVLKKNDPKWGGYAVGPIEKTKSGIYKIIVGY